MKCDICKKEIKAGDVHPDSEDEVYCSACGENRRSYLESEYLDQDVDRFIEQERRTSER